MARLQYILDIGSSKISLIAVSRFYGRLRAVTREDILYDGYMDGEFLSSDDLESTLSQLVDRMTTKMRKSIDSVIVGVPNEFCVCSCKRISRKFMELHKITNQDIHELYIKNAEFGDSEEYTMINYSPMQFIIDDNVRTLSPVGKRTQSLILDASYILAKQSFIDTMLTKLNSLGINNVEFISTGLGQAMYCSQIEEAKRPIAVVDVGHISTSVSVFKGEGLALLSSFSMGGGHISSDIMQVLGMSFKDSELVKRKIILTVESEKNEYYEVCSHGSLIKAPINITNQVVKSRIEQIAKVVAEILSIDEVFKDIDVYLTGDGIANFKGAKNILKKATGLNVHEFKNQFDNSNDKYQTSIEGLIRLAETAV